MADQQIGVKLERSFIERVIFGQRGDEPGGDEPRRYRFTQDSPILPDVWIRYGEQPATCQDLLLTPRFGVTAGTVASRLCQICRTDREKAGREKPDIAYNQTYVVARLYYDELIRFVLPMTRWWQHDVCQAMGKLMDVKIVEGEPEEPIKLAGLKAEQARLLEMLKAYDGHSAASSERAREIRDYADLLWMIRIVGSIGWARKAKRKNPRGAPPSFRQMVLAVVDLIGDLELTHEEAEKLVWQVNLNRLAGTAVDRSVLAVKADAARFLFKVDCSEVAWAVVDSGIDASHPAFWRWGGKPGDNARAVKGILPRQKQRGITRDFVEKRLEVLREGDPPEEDWWPALTRVKATYDFTRARDLFNLGVLEDEERWPPFVARNLRCAEISDGDGRTKDRAQELRDKLEELASRLAAGRGIDWSLAEPFLEVPHDDRRDKIAEDGSSAGNPRFYERPWSDHGTHVAGILGADWPKHKMEGMCPDLELYDMRVIGPDGNNDEFAVLSALQFIDHLNDQKDLFAVHGVNMSLSIRHDVANFACGRTPVCDECERLVASGVVVVAAAGNLGYQKFVTPNGEAESYNTVSITDPGNAEKVITVGATHRFQPHTYGVSYFSSRGPTGDGRLKPDLVAPGEKIEAPVPNHGSRSKDGTSMATPHVSGAAAMLLARHGELIGQPERIKQVLTETATDLGRERYFQGSGMLDVLRALQSI